MCNSNNTTVSVNAEMQVANIRKFFESNITFDEFAGLLDDVKDECGIDTLEGEEPNELYHTTNLIYLTGQLLKAIKPIMKPNGDKA